MSEYAPTTQEIKEFAAEMLGWDLADPDAAFDRWLAEERRAAAEKAWEEGRESLAIDVARPIGDDGMRHVTPNPYRAEETKA